MAEVAVHLTIATVPEDYVMTTIYIPPSVAGTRISTSALPADWNVFPYTAASQAIGDKFVAKNKYCTLQVPSAVTKGDHNILINPHHVDFSKIKIVDIEEFPFDKMIFRRL